MSEPASAAFKKVPPAAPPAVHTGGPRNYNWLRLIAAASDKSVDVGYELEWAQELRNRSPWLSNMKGFEGTLVPLESVLGVSKASGTNPSDNMEPLLGTDYRDELTRIDGAITRATITDKIGARVLTGLVERTVQFPRQTGQMSAGHVAIDSDLPTSADPTFDNVTLTPKLVGNIAQVNLSGRFAQHPELGTPSWHGMEQTRAVTVAVNDKVLNGDNTARSEEPDGLIVQSTAAATTPIPVAGDGSTVQALNGIKQEMRDYLQVDDDMLSRTHFIHHPRFWEALETQSSFTGSGNSVAVDVSAGAASRMRYVEAQMLPVTAGTPDTADGFLVADPSSIIHGFWSAASVAINPYADSVFASGGTLVRVMLMHDFLVIDPKRVLRTTTNLEP